MPPDNFSERQEFRKGCNLYFSDLLRLLLSGGRTCSFGCAWKEAPWGHAAPQLSAGVNLYVCTRLPYSQIDVGALLLRGWAQ